MFYSLFSIVTLLLLSDNAVLAIKNLLKTQQKKLVEREGYRGAKSFCSAAGWNHEWSDEFTEEALSSAWAPVVSSENAGDHSAPVSGLGVTACRTASCRAENVRLQDGQLILTSERDANDPTKYYTGAVTTRGLKNWKDDVPYRMCISAKLPGGQGSSQGVWPAHWMLPDNGLSEKCLDEGEMDIMEMINGDGGAYSTYHYMSSYPNLTCGDFNKYHKSRNSLTHVKDWHNDFHEYAVERSNDHLTYAIDGKVVQHLPVSALRVPLAKSPFFLILNTAIGGAWPGEPTAHTRMPVEHAIDYVRVSRRSHGALLEEALHAAPLGKSADELKDVAKSASWADAWHPSSLLEMEAGPPPPPMSLIQPISIDVF